MIIKKWGIILASILSFLHLNVQAQNKDKEVFIVEAKVDLIKQSKLDKKEYLKDVFVGCSIKVNDVIIPVKYINYMKFTSDNKPYVLVFDKNIEIIYPTPKSHRNYFISELTKNKIKCQNTRIKTKKINLIDDKKLMTELTKEHNNSNRYSQNKKVVEDNG